MTDLKDKNELIPPLIQSLKLEKDIVCGMLAELISEGVEFDNNLLKSVMNFALMRRHFLVLKGIKSNRQLENNVKFRLGTVDRIVDQMIRDKDYVEIEHYVNLLERQLFIAIIEKAAIIYESFNKSDVRDSTGIDLHLWSLKNFLVLKNIKKPIEVLLSILTKSGALEGIGRTWTIGTIKNKIARAQSVVDQFRKHGGCHIPIYFGEWSRIDSLAFSFSTADGRCPKCKKVWHRMFKIKSTEKAPLKLAAKELAKKYPRHDVIIEEIAKSIYQAGPDSYTLEGIVNRVPTKLMGTFGYLFQEYKADS